MDMTNIKFNILKTESEPYLTPKLHARDYVSDEDEDNDFMYLNSIYKIDQNENEQSKLNDSATDE